MIWITRLISLIGSIAALVAVLYVVASIWGWERVWEKTHGPADLGEINFAGLKKTSKPNQAILAPPELVAPSQIDITSPTYTLREPELIKRIEESIEESGNAERVDDNARPEYRRYVFRSRWLRFPDTMDIFVADNDVGGAQLAIYSRSQVGTSDFGINLARLRELRKALSQFEK